jgi:hypothetical protein
MEFLEEAMEEDRLFDELSRPKKPMLQARSVEKEGAAAQMRPDQSLRVSDARSRVARPPAAAPETVR